MAIFSSRDIESLVPFNTFCDACVCFLFCERVTGVIGLPAVSCFCVVGPNTQGDLFSLVSSLFSLLYSRLAGQSGSECCV